MYTVEKEIRWEMGHRLTLHDGKCFNLHGHSYKANIVFGSENLDANGMVIDFYHYAVIKEYIDRVWDHSLMLNAADEMAEVLPRQFPNLRYVFVTSEPTAENIARYLCKEASHLLEKECQANNVSILNVTVYETATSAATYIPENVSV